jgi:23S rRNA (uracil1939-C5)-methyltransferase
LSQSNAKNEVMLEIDSLSYGPYGIGRHHGQVVMVAGTVPGDRVSARVIESKGNFEIAELATVIEPSSQRRQPPCPYVGACGGCPWQQIQYAAQLMAKQRSVEDNLRRIGKLADFELLPIVAAPREYHYRRRIRLRSAENGNIGFSRSASHDLVEVDACEIGVAPINQTLKHIRRWLVQASTRLAEIEIVCGEEKNELVLVGFAAGPFADSDRGTVGDFLDSGAGISGVIMKGDGWRHVWGDSRITMVTEPAIRQLVEADLFTQVNPEGNRLILQQLLDSGKFDQRDRVLELYCGAGNFTLSIARRAGEVVAVEGHRRAIDNGRLNAQRNGIENIRWRAAPVPSAVVNLARRNERFSKVVLDPPRAGAKGIDRDLTALNAQTILYVSCNPATLARDLAALVKRGYKLAAVQPIDLFPQTFHVETLAIVKRQ